MNGVNCRILIKHLVDIIDGIRDMFIEMSKGIVSNEDIRLITNKYQILLKEMNTAYRCIRSLNVNDDVIYKIKFIYKIMTLLSN